MLKEGVFLRGDNIVFVKGDVEEIIMKTASVPMLGEHNLSNALCAILASLLYKINKPSIIEGIKTFKTSPHRLSFVAKKNGVSFVNDSKATNIDASIKATEAFSEKIILMLGGSDKSDNFDYLFKRLPKNVKAITVSGTNAQKNFR